MIVAMTGLMTLAIHKSTSVLRSPRKGVTGIVITLA